MSKSTPIHPDWAESHRKRCEAMNEAFRIAMYEAYPNIREGVAGPDPDVRPRRIGPAYLISGRGRRIIAGGLSGCR